MSPRPKKIGMRIKALRETRGLSQATVAKAARISREHLARLEGGHYDPSVGTLERIAEALGVSLMSVLRPRPPRHR
jgi:transcriptional regulator with XRE-family HTH domain